MISTQLAAPGGTADLIETTVAAPESLRPWITEMGSIPTVTNVTVPFAHVPHAGTTIVLWTDAAGRRDALVLGPVTRALYSKAEKPTGCTRLHLAPGATPQLLGVAAADLANRAFRLADLPGIAAGFADELAALPTDEVLPFLEAVLPRSISEGSTQRAHRELLRTAVASMSSRASAPVHELAADLAVSERQLRNLFTAGIGVSPKHYARIGRVRHVLTHAGSTPWAQIAASTGYYDQSHMAADFRVLMGVAPTSFLRGDLPAATPCQAPARR